jgi:hypothetical protein
MNINSMSAEQRKIIFQCLKATAAYIEDWEKHARLGLYPEELDAVIATWPHADESTRTYILAINNCLNEVAHGFRIAPEDWPKWFDVPPDQIEKTYEAWLALHNIDRGIM